MNKSLVIALFLGLLSQTEAVRVRTNENEGSLNSNVTQIHLKVMQQKVAEAKEKSDQTLAKINELKKKIDKKPAETSKVQTKKDEMVINLEALNKPNDANKMKELEAMEQALAKATEEAHKQRLRLAGTSSDSLAQESTPKSPALMELKKKHDQQQKELLDKLEQEEKTRQAELRQNIELEKKIEQAEKERLEEEELQKKRQQELKRLQAEEAAQKAEAEQREQEFLAAQAVQEAKQAAARKAAAKANLARLKRRNELQRTQAEAQLKLLRITHQ
jgi:hypothetical protein